jgi:membrane fusion protein (multidrug efflux system)
MRAVIRLSALALVAVVPLVACSKPQAPPTSAADKSTETSKDVPVSVGTVAAHPFVELVTITGELESFRSTQVAANAAGRVLEVLVDRGDRVKAGDVLARLDARQAQRNRDAVRVQRELADAQAQQAARECARAEELHRQGALATADQQAADTRCEAARLQVKAAEAQASIVDIALTDSTLRAPFDGVIARRMVEVGSFVQAPTPVVELQQVDPVVALLQVPAVHVARIQAGQRVLVEVPDIPELGRIEAPVSRISPSLGKDTRALAVAVDLANPEGRLRGGLFVRAMVETGQGAAAALPVEALVDRDNRLRVFVVEGGVARQHLVARMEPQQGFVRAPETIAAGATIVLSPPPTLRDGDSVVDAGPGAAAREAAPPAPPASPLPPAAAPAPAGSGE